MDVYPSIWQRPDSYGITFFTRWLKEAHALKTIAPKVFGVTAALAVKGGINRVMRTAPTLRAARLVEEQAPLLNTKKG